MKRVRGYVTSRPFFEHRVPQHVQNIVIRDFCARRGLHYLLSATEYAMPSCYMVLENTLKELGQIDGICLYSIFMLPHRASRRMQIYRRVFEAGACLHGAVESLTLEHEGDVRAIEDIWAVQQAMSGRPA